MKLHFTLCFIADRPHVNFNNDT